MGRIPRRPSRSRRARRHIPVWLGPVVLGLVVLFGVSIGLSAANVVPDGRMDAQTFSVTANDLAPAECINHHGPVLTNVVAGNGGGSNDLVLGTAGNDNLDGGGGTDCILGGAGDDTLTGGSGDNDYVWGQSGNDSVAGNGGSGDHCNGGSGSGDSTPLLLHGCESTSNIP